MAGYLLILIFAAVLTTSASLSYGDDSIFCCLLFDPSEIVSSAVKSIIMTFEH